MKILKVNIVLILVFLFVGCTKDVEIGTVVASVDEFYLTLEQLHASYGEENWQMMSKVEQREIINQWVDLTLLYSKAVSNDYFKDDIVLQFMSSSAEKKVYSNALISYELNNIQFSNEELYNAYRLREAEFTEQVREFRVQRIFFNTEEAMREVKGMLDRGEIRFTPAAQRYSEEPIGRNGGYMSSLVTKTSPDSLLWVELNNMDQYYEVTAPYQAGWVIARWYEYRASIASKSFHSVREEIELLMREERRHELYNQILTNARISSRVIITH